MRGVITGNFLRYFSGYFLTVWKILTGPRSFFSEFSIREGLSGPLAFALVTHWISKAMTYVWDILFFRRLSQQFFGQINLPQIDYPGRNYGDYETKRHIVDWFMGMGPVLMDPFLTLFSILGTSFVIYLGARILVSPRKDQHPDEISYSSAVQIISYGMTPTILSVIPVLGPWFATLGVMIVTVIGVQEVYRISLGRAICVTFFPALLFFGLLIGLGLTLMGFLFSMLFSFFM